MDVTVTVIVKRVNIKLYLDGSQGGCLYFRVMDME